MMFRRSSQEEVGFQMAPMIDIIFTLLLFYIVTTALQQQEKEITIALPQSKAGEEKGRFPSEIVINVTEAGDIVVGPEKLTLEVLSEKLKQLAEFYQDSMPPAVIVRGDKKAVYGRIVEILDICAQASMHNVSFVSVEKE
ncbi:MAG: biopolymer transporter ExbD [Planctomycetes bacterium]|nr:biopolymer transporter ExbD [Planctomycetota bacterium]